MIDLKKKTTKNNISKCLLVLSGSGPWGWFVFKVSHNFIIPRVSKGTDDERRKVSWVSLCDVFRQFFLKAFVALPEKHPYRLA